MTGHGRGEARTKVWSAVVECHSVNRKTAEVVFHADRDATWLEPSVREKVLERISRGRVQVNLHLERADAGTKNFFDEKRAAVFVEQARKLQKKLGLEGGVTLADVLSAPGVMRAAEPGGDDARDPVMKALEEAIRGLESTRNREGAALKKALLRSAEKLESLAKKIAPHAGRVAELHREALHKRIERAGISLQPDDARLASEVAFFAERCDITEELERAASHIAQFRDKLDSKGPVGRTLEFLAQELGREFNTIGSKSSTTAIARLASEVAFFAERCDITEELERAASHIAQFRDKLDSKAPVGRTLEFLAQELGREFNTIGSKSSTTAIARLVIEAKAELDRIREQLANIE
jgi:uncharacterized protein (TIGR00255 family)